MSVRLSPADCLFHLAVGAFGTSAGAAPSLSATTIPSEALIQPAELAASLKTAPPALVLLRRLETEEPPPVGEVGPAALLAELFES